MQHLIRKQCFLAQSGYVLKQRNDVFLIITCKVTNTLRCFFFFTHFNKKCFLLLQISEGKLGEQWLCVWICTYCKAWSYKYLIWLILLTWAPACMNQVTHMHKCLQDWAPKSIKSMVEIYKIYNWWTNELGFCSKVGRKGLSLRQALSSVTVSDW